MYQEIIAQQIETCKRCGGEISEGERCWCDEDDCLCETCYNILEVLQNEEDGIKEEN